MRNLRARRSAGAMISFTNQKGEYCVVPLMLLDGEWRQVGVYLVYGTSKSDPAYASVHALSHKWVPTRRMISAIRRAKR